MRTLVALFLVLNVAFTTELFSQTPEVKWGEEFKFEKKISIREMLSDKNSFYVIKRSTKRDVNQLLIEKFSGTTVQLETSATVPFPQSNGKTHHFEDIFLINGNLWMFTSVLDSTMRHVLYAAKIDQSLKVSSPVIEVDQMRSGSPKNPGQAHFEFVESPDAKSLLIWHNTPFQKYNNESFSYRVYNSEMGIVWRKDIELPYKDQFFKLTDHILDNEGNVYMISSISPPREKGDDTEKGIPNNKYNLLGYYAKENKLKEVEITLGEKWVSALTFGLAPNGDLVLGGFYSNSQLYSIAGTFYLRMDPVTRSVRTTNLKAFEKDFLMQFMPERKVKKGKELSDFYFDHFIVREDGSALFVAEQYYMNVVYSYNDPFGYGSPYGYSGYSPYYYSRNNYNYQYYYNDLILVSVNKEGEIEWTRKIPKRQMSTNDGGYYSSYSLAHNDKNVYILFNDNPRNTPDFRKAGHEIFTMSKPSKSTAMLVTVDREGKIVYSGLFSQRDMKLILRPKMYYQSGANQLLIFSQRGSKYKFGSVTLP